METFSSLVVCRAVIRSSCIRYISEDGRRDGNVPKRRQVGTRSLGTIVSFMHFNDRRRHVSGCMEGWRVRRTV